MTQEEKQLLLKDLCMRVGYGVKFVFGGNIYTMKGIDLIVTDEFVREYAVTAKGIEPIEIEYIKPYLRPMSSMTEEEENEYSAINCYEGIFPRNEDALDYVLSHHFDFRNLIEKGLALEAPEGMYKRE